jgi:hypothetical protein
VGLVGRGPRSVGQVAVEPTGTLCASHRHSRVVVGRRSRVVVLALVCVLAVSVAAATLPAPTDPTGDGTGGGDDSRLGGPGQHDTGNRSSGVNRNVEESPGRKTPPLGGVCVRQLQSPAFFALVAVLAVGAATTIRRRVGTTPAVVLVGAGVLSAIPLWFIVTDCRSSITPEPQEIEELVFAPGEIGESGGGRAAAQTATNLVTEPLILVGVVAVVVGLVAVAYYASGDDEPPDDDRGDDEADYVDVDANADLSVVGTAVGEAADRIEDASDVDNEVYRAWREMAAATDLPDPETATPGEFAAAARDAGMPDDGVAALTDVFREVRYGGAEATADREERAVDALRDVQAAATDAAGEREAAATDASDPDATDASDAAGESAADQ